MNQVQVEHRLSFTVVVAPASGNWKHPLPLKIRFLFKTLLCPFPVVTSVLEMAELVPFIVQKHEEFNPLTANDALPNYSSTEAVNAVT